jgi:hypothetical protein
MVTAVAQEPPLTQSGTVAVAVENMPEQPAQNIYRVPWNREQMLPFIITCSPDDTVLIELPYPAVAWHGRGFIPQDVTRTGQDSQQPVLGDFAIYPGNVSGEKIISITALVEKSARTLHIVMEENRLLTLECLVAESRNNAFRAVVFIDNLAQSQRVENAVREERTRVTSFIRSDEPPISKYQEPSAETQLGLKNFMKALLSVDEERALSLLRANPAIQFNFPKGAGAQAFDYGLYTITQRFVLRDAVTDTLGLCVAMKNNSASRLLFDPAGWVLRAGDHIYPVPTVEFSGEIEPGQATTAFLIIARDVNGRPTRLLPTTPMQVSAKIVGAVNPRPLIMEAVDVH